MAPKPSGPHLAQRLRTLSLTSPPATGLFYARLYYASFPPTEAEHDSSHVLALCLLQSDQPYPALQAVRDSANGDGDPDDMDYESTDKPGCYGCAVIVAKCCNRLSRFTEGQAVSERAVRRSTPMTLPVVTPAETAATANLMLASLSHKGKSPMQAVEFYAKALSEDPWSWEAFTGLCDIGAPPSPETVFPDPPSARSSARPSRNATLSPGPMPRSSASEVPNFISRRQMSPLATAAPTTSSLFTPGVSNHPPKFGMSGNPSNWETPSTVADTSFPGFNDQGPSGRRALPNSMSSILPSSSRATTPINAAPDSMSRPPAQKRPRAAHGPRRFAAADTPTGGPSAGESRSNGRDLKSSDTNGDKMSEAPVRRSSRLNANGPTKPQPRVTRKDRSTRSQSVASSASGTAEPATSAADAQVQAAVDDWSRDIVRRCARAYRSSRLYNCKEASSESDESPSELQTSVWAYEMAANCFYEMSDNVKARRAFQKLISADPYRLTGMELYSTVSWHLGDTAASSHSSQHSVSIDRDAPQPWIATGNCFSSQRDHDEAMRCFRRAAQLSPGCPYAWTLCGYEAVAMEEYDRAIAFYRNAIRADSRHYNAWYGSGVVYSNMGKSRHAEHHFRRAAEINPSNSASLCCIGDVLEKVGNSPGALAVYDQACAVGSTAMSVYRRARVLVALGRIMEAISALEPLIRDTPDEANVHFLLGKCYSRVGRNDNAMTCFTAAQESQPKSSSSIKATISARGEEEEASEEE